MYAIGGANWVSVRGPHGRVGRGATLLRDRVPAGALLWSQAAMGVVAAAWVGYLTAQNPHAGPAGVAVLVRVSIIASLVAAGVYAQTRRIQARMGALLVPAGLYATLWLLNGSGDRIAFSIGLLCSALAPVLSCYLLLAYPSGRLRSSAERRWLATVGGAVVALWVVLVVTNVQPPLRTPLLRCLPQCPRNEFFLGVTIDDAIPVLKVVLRLVWTVLVCGTVVVVARRWRVPSRAVRRSMAPIGIVAIANAVFLIGFFVARAVGSSKATEVFGAGYVSIWVLIPLAIFLGLALERLFFGQALAGLVHEFGSNRSEDPQSLIATALNDSTLTIAYRRPGTGAFVDQAGTPVAVPLDEPGRAVCRIERDGQPVAAVIYDAELVDEERFLQAVGDAALLHLERAQLGADLKASTAELGASRLRLVEAAHTERQRIERDLHDGVQQDLVGLRIKLQFAAEAIKQEPAEGERLVAAIGEQMDSVLESLRALARGIYPALLQDQGIGQALKSAARRSPLPISVHADAVGRYPQDAEVAVYFCCLEALQNAVKHGGPGTTASVHLRDEGRHLRFEVTDTGRGFDPGRAAGGAGLTNMRDRIEAVGGTLTIASRTGQGTTISGQVPTIPPP